ncbi:hypothetical protein Zmor_022177 [Zophobas morio]|uniref:Uncharacterized protein n=1 Tax=Zophobas morio TaxID=2755281 RepID=A0AA38HWD4_9CUCU|nr:hypothetical protein Zmor_022177 [Zophobas morio]
MNFVTWQPIFAGIPKCANKRVTSAAATLKPPIDSEMAGTRSMQGKFHPCHLEERGGMPPPPGAGKRRHVDELSQNPERFLPPSQRFSFLK